MLFVIAVPKGRAQSATAPAYFGTVTTTSTEAQACFSWPEGAYQGYFSYSSGNTTFNVPGGTMSVSAPYVSSYSENCFPVFFTAGSGTGPLSLYGSTTLYFSAGEGRNIAVTVTTSGTYQ